MILFLDSEALESVTGSGSDSDLQSKQVPTVSGCVRRSFTIPAAEPQPLATIAFRGFFFPASHLWFPRFIAQDEQNTTHKDQSSALKYKSVMSKYYKQGQQ